MEITENTELIKKKNKAGNEKHNRKSDNLINIVQIIFSVILPRKDMVATLSFLGNSGRLQHIQKCQ